MRFRQLRTTAAAACLGLLTALGSTACLITGFDLPVQSLPMLILYWSMGALFLGWLVGQRYGVGVSWYLLALAAGYLWHGGELIPQIKALIYRIGSLYGSVYRFELLIFQQEAAEAGSLDLVLGLFGLLLIQLVCISVCRRGTVFFGVILAVLPLGACLVTTVTVPEIWALFCLLLGVTLLILTGGVRRESRSQGDRLAAMAAIPAALAVGLLLLLLPQSSYVDRSGEAREYILSLMEDLPNFAEGSGSLQLFTPQKRPGEQVDLSGLDGQTRQEIPILEVTAQRSGTLYLRGQDYNRYTGRGWESDPGRREDFTGWGTEVERIKITTFAQHGVLYLPYYPGGTPRLEGGMVRNSGGQMVYTLSRYSSGSAVSPQVLEENLQLPEGLAEQYRKLYLPERGTNTAAAAAVGDYVRSAARYDRETGKMPEGEPDFALWFLKNGDTGYCVHFATASAVLLRAVGVPARYVTGYKVEAIAGEPVTVKAKDAHAWAEYYDPEAGMWRILESTPPELTEDGELPPETEPLLPDIPETLPTTATMPPETVPVTEPDPETPPVPAGNSGLRKLGFGILALATLLAVLFLRRVICLALRQRRLAASQPNAQALLYRRDAERMAKILKEDLPEDLEELAQKAVFSQYVLEPGELQVFAEYRRKCRRILQKAPWYKQFIYRYILVLY